MPNVTADGRPIRWQLPRALIALLVDRLTGRHVIGLVNGIDISPSTEGRYMSADDLRFLSLPYFHFTYRTDSSQPLHCHLPAQSIRPVDGSPAASFKGSDDELLDSFVYNGSLVRIGNMEEAHDLPELLPLAGHWAEGGQWPCYLYSLWYGHALRQALETATAADGGSGEPVVVELDDAPGCV